MKIVGIEKNSFVDYPGKIAAVAFTPGCNMNCFYCHNRDIICKNQGQKLLDAEAFLKFLEKRKVFLDGVVISGGEPTLQAGLEAYITRIKALGYPVKLDTNGTRPQILKRLIDEGLLDYVAMDVKAPLEKYEEICGISVELDCIEASMALLLEGNIDYEFRTTFVPQLTEEDGVNIAQRIKGARRYVLQQFRRPVMETDFEDWRLEESPHSADRIYSLGKQIKRLVQDFELRGVGWNHASLQ